MIYFSAVCAALLLMIAELPGSMTAVCIRCSIFHTSAQFSTSVTVMIDKHGLVLHFRFPQGWAVVGKNEEFCFALFDHFQRLLVPQHILSTFHNKLEPRLDPLQQLFCLLCSHYPPALGMARPPTNSQPNRPGSQKGRRAYIF